jgi:ubiquitin C-terminal hydrolase
VVIHWYSYPRRRYCPRCREHRQALKELRLWRAPPILVIHLKRFQYDGWYREKIETVVDCPVKGLDLSAYVLDPREATRHAVVSGGSSTCGSWVPMS